MAFILPLLGLLCMIGFPKEWQNVQGWIAVSYLGIPLFLAVVAVAITYPVLLFGILFFVGMCVK